MISRHSSTVEVFRDRWPTSRYVAVDKLVAGDGSTQTDQPALEARLLARGGQLGCDGLIIEKVDHAADHQVTRVAADCIVYKDGPGADTNSLPGYRAR